ncbi:MAG: DUF484 family protein, partial [Rhodovarius sp.]|nr:DUF484 family protein [Rhodovarius sp.]
MKTPRNSTLSRSGITAAQVEEYLRAHPDFLAQRPELYLVLEPPQRVHGDRMADHMAAMLAAARVHLREAEAEGQAARGRAQGFADRAALAVLALLRAPDVLECVTQEWPQILGVRCCHIGCEATQRRYVPRLPAGTVADLLPPGRDAVIRLTPIQLPLLHRESAPHIVRDALARIPAPGGQPMLLAIGAASAEELPTGAVESVL